MKRRHQHTMHPDFKRSYRRSKFVQIIAWVMIVAFMLIAVFGNLIITRATRTTIVATVTDKDIKRDKNTDEDKKADDIYMIYAEDASGNTYVFTDEDELWYWKWNSSDVYAKIKVGKTYEFEVCGVRIPFLSSYQNIIDVTEVE